MISIFCDCHSFYRIPSASGFQKSLKLFLLIRSIDVRSTKSNQRINSILPRVVVPVKILFMGQKEQFNYLLYMKPVKCVHTND